MSAGFQDRVLVEIKLSTNAKIVAGYTRQLETYERAEATTRGFYVVINVGACGKRQAAYRGEEPRRSGGSENLRNSVRRRAAETFHEQTVETAGKQGAATIYYLYYTTHVTLTSLCMCLHLLIILSNWYR
jgi:hypothetical protein